MSQPPKDLLASKDVLHPRNQHRARYDFAALVQTSPALAPFVHRNTFSEASIDFADPEAVKLLNQALLRHFYGIEHWDIPAGYLCPPIPGRADYLHYLADLLAASNGGAVPRGQVLSVLDVGVGANCIYPLIGHQEYGWRFVGSETDPVALRAARQIVAANPALTGSIDCRLQPDARHVLAGLAKPGEVFDATLCNPPFYGSAAEAAAGTQRKLSNLGTGRGTQPVRNFGGKNAELWSPGGEAGFVRRLVQESHQLPTLSFWFTTLVSQKDTLPAVYHALRYAKAADVRTIDMAQGQKKSRLVAWTFLTPDQQEDWRRTRWAAQQ
ncbi:23S rRNA (adenine(1618)-N(6))-methyltransferase RlmF [Hymenobacter sp. HMF4947]|uniref:Ribosomal RNA large subunit methyltransferase F n=1 Tax=Hymenobacter ginkgonis TaxID=2682976 RepID=A0A7K1TFM6_9BACT|nr:23S rRNA (adenine(1618)-N(6))-methyltransferase RlmF [Hymenobacter ginkgonis]MVN77203.1 23S rRNA (adenine(1618)-N(6))-methyltransferase RlmF [Hymenobacter ginkgonis]